MDEVKQNSQLRWKTALFGNLAEFKNGLNYSKENIGVGLKIIGVSDFQNHSSIEYDALDEVSGFEHIDDSYLLREDDLLFVRSNGNKNLIGRVLHIKSLGQERVTFSGFTIRARINSSEILPAYAALLFSTPEIKARLFAEGGGTNIANLNQDLLSMMAMQLPPISKQAEVIAAATTWDEAIALQTRQLRQLQRRKDGIAQELLPQRKRLPSFASKPLLASAGTLFHPISIRGHEHEELLSVTQEQGVMPRSMLEGRVVMPEGTTAAYKLVEPGNFVISLRSFQGGIEYSDYRGLVSPAYTVLQPTDKVEPDYYKHYFKSADFISRLSSAVIGIRDGKQISFKDFAVINIPHPELNEQRAIAEVLNTAEAEIRLTERKLAALREQKRGLLQQLLTGEILLS